MALHEHNTLKIYIGGKIEHYHNVQDFHFDHELHQYCFTIGENTQCPSRSSEKLIVGECIRFFANHEFKLHNEHEL